MRIGDEQEPIIGPPDRINWNDLIPPGRKVADFMQAAVGTFCLIVSLYVWVQFFRWLV